ncbi:9325_t:CDS:2 [Funneliformis geosporum]|nr:9325_t:CDS:2 [Funneliformis geosporum]
MVISDTKILTYSSGTLIVAPPTQYFYTSTLLENGKDTCKEISITMVAEMIF